MTPRKWRHPSAAKTESNDGRYFGVLRYFICSETDSCNHWFSGLLLTCILWVCVAIPLDGNYTDWGPWSPCTETCGKGEKYRMRNCSNPTPAFYGKTCSFVGEDREVQECKMKDCEGWWNTLLWLSSPHTPFFYSEMTHLRNYSFFFSIFLF